MKIQNFNVHGGQVNIADRIEKIEYNTSLGISRDEFDAIKRQIEQLSLEKREEIKTIIVESETPSNEVEKQSIGKKIYNWQNVNSEDITKELTAATLYEGFKYLLFS